MKVNTELQKKLNIIICFLVIFICLGFCSANKNLFLVAICDALDFKRTIFSFSTSCRYIITAVVNVFFGFLILKFGAKKLISVGVIFLIVSMLLSSVSTGIGLFILAELCSGIGFSLSGTAMAGWVANRFCARKKGAVTGAILSANGIGGAISAQIITPMIYNYNNPFGYRNAYKFIAILLLGLLILVFILFKDSTAKGSFNNKKVDNKLKEKNLSPKASFTQIKQRPLFWILLICIFFIGFCLQGITGISAAHMYDIGFSSEFVAVISGISLLALTGAKFLAGFMNDKIGLFKTVTICSLAAVLCMLSLAFITLSNIGRVLSVIYAVFSSIALPLETVMLPLYAAELFDSQSFEKIMGIFISVNTAGYAVGTPLVNVGYDLTGSYQSILIITSLIMLFITVAMGFIIKRMKSFEQSGSSSMIDK